MVPVTDDNLRARVIFENDRIFIQTLAAHKHKHIANPKQCSDEAAIVQECFRGGDLSYHIFVHGSFSVPTARAFFLQLTDALIHLYNHGRVHRDLKPWNVVLSDDLTEIKLIDFGLSTPIAKTPTTADTHVEAAYESLWWEFQSGTRQYMAPELFRLGLGPTDLSVVDVFSLGVLLINLLTGEYAFKDYTDPAFRAFVESPEEWLKTNACLRIDSEELSALSNLLQHML